MENSAHKLNPSPETPLIKISDLKGKATFEPHYIESMKVIYGMDGVEKQPEPKAEPQPEPKDRPKSSEIVEAMWLIQLFM